MKDKNHFALLRRLREKENGFAQIGTPDNTFSGSDIAAANITISATALQTDGKTIIGGNFTNYIVLERNRIAGIHNTGSPDSTFNQGSGANGNIAAITFPSDGKIIFGGSFVF